MIPASRALVVAAIAVVAWGASTCMHPFECDKEGLKSTVPDSFVVAFETSRGRVDVMARKAWAPIGVSRFFELVTTKFFDDARFFRVIREFVAQFGMSGDPATAAAWKDRCLADEPVKHSNTRGTISFARGGPGTRSTQMFVNLVDNADLDSAGEFGFPAFAEVVSGMSAVDSLYSAYGESAPRSGPYFAHEGPRQDSIAAQGNAYLIRGWPKLDYIKTARIVQQWPK